MGSAGSHSEKLRTQYEKICKRASIKGLEAVQHGASAVDAVALATAALEDSPLTNAGIGSSLTWDGIVECDASLMDGDRLGFGGVGAVRRVKNPVLLARSLCLAQYEKLSLGRIPPCILVGDGAEKWAEDKGLEIVQPEALISSKSSNTYKKYKRRAEISNSEGSVKDRLLDTVGAVVVDLNGKVAAASSSGGILLKHPGRVGQAGVWGCGCWAENHEGQVGGTMQGIGVSASGCGEDLIRTTFAKQTAVAVSSSPNLTSALTGSLQTFLDSPYLGVKSEKLCGVIALDVDGQSGRGEFSWAHTSSSMVVGYMSSSHSSPQSRVSRLPRNVRPGTSIAIEGVSF